MPCPGRKKRESAETSGFCNLCYDYNRELHGAAGFGMKWKITNLRRDLYLIATIILLVGLGSAALIYLTAENDSDSGLIYDGSKMYKHDLELYGGKANMLADEFRQWFVGLWHGKSLAFTVACIAIFVSFGFFFVTSHLPSDPKSDAQGGNNRSGTD
jgi:hypothetical protein